MRPGAAVASGLTTSGPPKSLLFVPACHIQMLISRRSCPMMVEKVENALSLAISLGEMRYGDQENTSQKDRALPMTFHAPPTCCVTFSSVPGMEESLLLCIGKTRKGTFSSRRGWGGHLGYMRVGPHLGLLGKYGVSEHSKVFVQLHTL